MAIELKYVGNIKSMPFRDALMNAMKRHVWRKGVRRGEYYLLLPRRRVLFLEMLLMACVCLGAGGTAYFALFNSLAPALAIFVFLAVGSMLYMLFLWRNLARLSILPAVRISPDEGCITFFRRGECSFIIIPQSRLKMKLDEIDFFEYAESTQFSCDGVEFYVNSGRAIARFAALYAVLRNGERVLLMTCLDSDRKCLFKLCRLAGKDCRPAQ